MSHFLVAKKLGYIPNKIRLTFFGASLEGYDDFLISDEIKIAVYAMILEGIKNGDIKSDSYALWQPMAYLLNVKENNEVAITCLKNTKSISFSCYKDLFFFLPICLELYLIRLIHQP